MPYIVTEPVKIEGTKLGYALFPYQFSFADIKRESDDHLMRLYIYELKDSKFIEVEKTLFQKDFSISMQSAHIVEETLKDFIVKNQDYVQNVNVLENFFNPIKPNKNYIKD